MTGGLSPIALTSAYFDWLSHLAASPSIQIELRNLAISNVAELARYSICAATNPEDAVCTIPREDDKPFDRQEWAKFPFNVLTQSFLLTQSGGVTRLRACTVSTRKINRLSHSWRGSAST